MVAKNYIDEDTAGSDISESGIRISPMGQEREVAEVLHRVLHSHSNLFGDHYLDPDNRKNGPVTHIKPDENGTLVHVGTIEVEEISRREEARSKYTFNQMSGDTDDTVGVLNYSDEEEDVEIEHDNDMLPVSSLD
ncbi:MAG: hypothetical protein COB36_05795 [Alphaproteobacteria bacterium]|nr:MAG: hypothetical protein COB36_05795 [Alphaproteobacteria bacterium]